MKYIEYSALQPEQFHEMVPVRQRNKNLFLTISLVGLSSLFAFLYWQEKEEAQRLRQNLTKLKPKAESQFPT